MLVQYSNIPKGEAKVRVQHMDDLWYLSHIIDINDSVSGQTIRKIKIGSGDEMNANVVKKKIFLTIDVERIEFHKDTGALRIGGIITAGPEDIPRGQHHTFNVEEGSILSIKKRNGFLRHQVDKLKESAENRSTGCMVCALDRDVCHFALLKKYGFDIIGTVSGDVQKKYAEGQAKGNFYSDVAKHLTDYVERYSIKHLVIGSPAFWKDELKKELMKKGLHEKVTLAFATCNSTGQNAIVEILKRPETAQLLKEERSASEMGLVEVLLSEISKSDLAVYGIKETENAANMGAVRLLLVTDAFIHKSREAENYGRLDRVMFAVERSKGDVHVISSDHEGGQKLDGLGGIGGVLRYKMI